MTSGDGRHRTIAPAACLDGAMAELIVDTWPPEPLLTERLVLRESRKQDRDGLISLLTSDDARRHLGGPLSRERAERSVVPPYGETPGSFVIVEAGSGDFVGITRIDRRDPDRPGHLSPNGKDELELSYVLLPGYWGKGYAQDSVRAVLTWASTVVSDEKVVAVTQSANERSLTLLRRLGFTEFMRFEEFGAEQSMNVADLRRSAC
jgi:RimJ/RimL family protein N-acetyltransferase